MIQVHCWFSKKLQKKKKKTQKTQLPNIKRKHHQASSLVNINSVNKAEQYKSIIRINNRTVQLFKNASPAHRNMPWSHEANIFKFETYVGIFIYNRKKWHFFLLYTIETIQTALTTPERFQPFFKQKCPTFAGSSFVYVWVCCHLLSFLGIHESLGFGLDKRNYLKTSLWALGTCLV